MRVLALVLILFFTNMMTTGFAAETAGSGEVVEAHLHFDFTAAKPPRSVEADVWYPAKGESAAKYPVLLYFPGWGAKVSINASLLSKLASKGFVVVGLSYPTGAGLPDPAVPMQFAPDEGYASGTLQGNTVVKIEAEDATLALDQLRVMADGKTGAPFLRLMDTSKAGVLGYSLGGSVAAEAAFKDPRFKAVLNLDGWMFGDVATGLFTQPYLVISDDLAPATSEQMASTDAFMRNFSQLRDHDKKHQTAQLEKSRGFRITITGASHFSFSDEAKANEKNAGPIEPKRALEIVGAYAADFFGKYLAGRAAPLLEGPSASFSETKFESFPAKS